MAVVTTNYVKRNGRERGGAKAHIRYFEQRPGRDRAKITRTLFGVDGAMTRQQACRLIDEAAKPSLFYRLVITLDPNLEDAGKDLNLRELTEKTMQKIKELMKKEITWVGTVHADHRPHRHVHALAILPRILNTHELQTLIRAASREVAYQRRQLDLARGRVQGRLTKHPARKQQAAGRTLRQAGVKRVPERGGVSSRPQICFCPRCGYRQLTPHIEHTSHNCLQCGLKLHQGKKISLNRNTKERQAPWEL